MPVAFSTIASCLKGAGGYRTNWAFIESAVGSKNIMSLSRVVYEKGTEEDTSVIGDWRYNTPIGDRYKQVFGISNLLPN